MCQNFFNFGNEHHVALDINSFKSMPRELVKFGEAIYWPGYKNL